jgi:Transposase IS116/IS110/IS902 family
MRAVLKAQINKTDRNDARGIAQMMRVGLYRPVHVKGVPPPDDNPGVGPVVALTYRATVDVPARFRKSKSVGAVFGLTCSRDQSGERDRPGAISRCGDEMMPAMLVRSTRWSWLKAWAMQVAKRRGMKRAIVALARRLAVTLDPNRPIREADIIARAVVVP